MKLSFPYMGCVTGYKKIFELLGHEVIMPPRPTQRTFDLGVKYSPEFICYPYKVIMGTYIELAEQGVEAIFSSGGNGPCRAGMYGEIHERTLKQLGYDIPVIIFDSIFKDPKDFWAKLKMVMGGSSPAKAAHAMLLGLKVIMQMDAFEKRVKVDRAYEQRAGDFNRAWTEITSLHESCDTFKELKKVRRRSDEILSRVPVRPREDRLRFGIVGEIYVVMESSTNGDIEQRLNKMGIEVESDQYISDWFWHNVIPERFNRRKSWQVMDKAKRYSKYNCGGHDLENMGWIIDYAEQGFDAVIHLLPFGCLPELVSCSMIPQISRDYNIPVLSISLDEQSGSANNQTRLEAFVDLVKNKRGALNVGTVSGR